MQRFLVSIHDAASPRTLPQISAETKRNSSMLEFSLKRHERPGRVL